MAIDPIVFEEEPHELKNSALLRRFKFKRLFEKIDCSKLEILGFYPISATLNNFVIHAFCSYAAASFVQYYLNDLLGSTVFAAGTTVNCQIIHTYYVDGLNSTLLFRMKLI